MNLVQWLLELWYSEEAIEELVSEGEPEAESGEDSLACNVSGHNWTEWEDDPFAPHTSSIGSGVHDLHVYQGQHRECKKCDAYESRNKTLGYIDKTGDDIKVVK